MNRLSFLLAGAAMAVVAAPSWAHAVLKASTPAAGGQLAASPIELRLTFNEPLEARFSKVQLTPTGKAALETGDAQPADGDPHTLVVPVKATLASGSYVVHWSAMGQDGHRTKGEFKFSVK